MGKVDRKRKITTFFFSHSTFPVCGCCLLLRILILYNSLRWQEVMVLSAGSLVALELEVEGELPDKVSCYQGVFYNYFSIGLHLNIVSFVGYIHTFSCKMDGCPSLKNILRIYAKKVNSSEWEQIIVPSSVRSIVALNLPSYGSGRNPWGNLKPDYLEKRGFVEAHADDGLLEVFGFKQGWHASMVMVELISAKHITQASAIRFELRGGEWTEGYMQMDGEPWK
ncbi:hypothetical protein ACS0TY_007732 [Phlomoides rotata]